MDDFLKGFLQGIEKDELSTSNWVEWMHISQGKTHCEDCLVLDQCWFEKSNKPQIPRHPYCHCVTAPLPYSHVLNNANTLSPHGKYIPYLFNTTGKYSHGKELLFENWGFHSKRCRILENNYRRTSII